jgi:hypothetical protein
MKPRPKITSMATTLSTIAAKIACSGEMLNKFEAYTIIPSLKPRFPGMMEMRNENWDKDRIMRASRKLTFTSRNEKHRNSRVAMTIKYRNEKRQK